MYYVGPGALRGRDNLGEFRALYREFSAFGRYSQPYSGGGSRDAPFAVSAARTSCQSLNGN